jgi:hypothetical protein
MDTTHSQQTLTGFLWMKLVQNNYSTTQYEEDVCEEVCDMSLWLGKSDLSHMWK